MKYLSTLVILLSTLTYAKPLIPIDTACCDCLDSRFYSTLDKFDVSEIDCSIVEAELEQHNAHSVSDIIDGDDEYLALIPKIKKKCGLQ